MKQFFATGPGLNAGANAIKKIALLLTVFTATCLATATAHAQFSRTFVSATGTNNSECSFTSPCQTFAQAIAVTSSNGEINCLTPGNFSTVTISISVTIDCEGVSGGGIMANGSSNPITINTAGIVVNLIGLDINGNGTDWIGVAIGAAANVAIRNCKVYGFPGGTGILFQPSSSGGRLVVDNAFVANNTNGITEYAINSLANMSVRNSNIIGNNATGILVEISGGTHAGVTVEQTTLAFNSQYGLFAYGTGALALIGGSTIVNNGTGVGTQNGGTVYSFKNNQIGGNGTDGTPITAYPGGPLN